MQLLHAETFACQRNLLITICFLTTLSLRLVHAHTCCKCTCTALPSRSCTPRCRNFKIQSTAAVALCRQLGRRWPLPCCCHCGIAVSIPSSALMAGTVGAAAHLTSPHNTTQRGSSCLLCPGGGQGIQHVLRSQHAGILLQRLRGPQLHRQAHRQACGHVHNISCQMLGVQGAENCKSKSNQ